MADEFPTQRSRAPGQASKESFSKTRGKREGGRPRFVPRRRVCYFCVYKDKAINYKDTLLLKGYLSERGKIEPRRRSGNCAKHQRAISLSIKRARTLGLLPFTGEHIRKMGIAGLGIRPMVKEPPREVRQSGGPAEPRQQTANGRQ